MARISELIRSSNRMHRYVTCFYAELNHARGTLTYVNAGHPAPILVGRGPRRARLARGGAVLGLLPNTTFDSETIALEPGDALAIFSDGVSEAMSPAEVEFGDTGVERVLVSAAGETAPDTLSRLEDALERFCDGRAFGDDRTAVILRAHD
jgi:sigma-B regulation protein RsbU (phosphoserine phosphatase)